jgi:peptidase M50B-like protein
VSATQVPLPAHTAVLIGLVAFGAVAFDVTWFLVRYVTVMAHEGAHAVAMSLLFRGVEGIRLRARRAEGGTTPKKGGARLGTSSIAFVGYLGPSAFGLGAAKLIELGDIAVMLWGALFLLGILLLALRRSLASSPSSSRAAWYSSLPAVRRCRLRSSQHTRSPGCCWCRGCAGSLK